MTFRMQSWSSSRAEWSSMDEGSAKSVWKPRRTREEAVHKCIEWTGAVMIPAMRVLDMDADAVIWQDTSQYPDAGDLLVPDWTGVLYEQVRAEGRREYLASLCECGMPRYSVACLSNHAGGIPPKPVEATAVSTDDGSLFSLGEMVS